MQLALLSDTHFEYQADNGDSFIQSLDSSGVDVLIMAGDIMQLNSFENAKKVLKLLFDKYKYIIYVLGNHEYHTSSPKHVNRLIERLRKEFSQDRFFVFDEPGKCKIENQNFICGTMWYSYDDDNKKYEDFMPDKGLIKSFIPWVYEQNQMFEHLITGNLTSSDIVITHHMPSYKCVSSQFIGSALNRFFVCEMDNIIAERNPKLWISGHSHTPVNIKISNTKIVTNPFGYLGENSRYKDKLVLDSNNL